MATKPLMLLGALSIKPVSTNSSDRQDKYLIGPICLVSSQTKMSDVAYNTLYIMYTQSQTDTYISSVLWNDSPNRTECPMKFQKVSRTLLNCQIQTVFQLENEKGRALGRALWARRAHFRALWSREGTKFLAKTNFVIVKKSQYWCHGTRTCKDSLWKIGNCTVLIRGIPLQVLIDCTNKLIYCKNKVFIYVNE